VKESDAIEFLRTRVADEGYIVVGQVPDGTGAAKRRTIDALMVQCWPSRGLSLTAIEYKRTVADFRRELKQPEKAESVAAYCDALIVLAPKGVVPAAELPPAWGLWEIHETAKQRRLLRTVAPQPTAERTKAVPLKFLVSILRARERYNGDAGRLEEARRADRERYRREVEDAFLVRTRSLRRKLEKVEEFEEASGLKITDGWGFDRLGPNLREYLRDTDQFRNRLQRQREACAAIMQAIDKATEGME